MLCTSPSPRLRSMLPRAGCTSRQSAARPPPAGAQAQQLFLPEQAVQDGVHVQRRSSSRVRLAASEWRCGCSPRSGRSGLRRWPFGGARQVALALSGMRWISRPAATWSLAASTSVVSSCSGLQHVVLQHIAEPGELFLVVAMQRHRALIGLLAGRRSPGSSVMAQRPPPPHSPCPAGAHRPAARRSPRPSRAGSGRTAPRPRPASPARRQRSAAPARR